MPADQVISKSLRRGARHVRLLSLLEGGLLVVTTTGAALFLAVLLDHAFSLSVALRTALLAAALAAALYLGLTAVLVPFCRSISPKISSRVRLSSAHTGLSVQPLRKSISRLET